MGCWVGALLWVGPGLPPATGDFLHCLSQAACAPTGRAVSGTQKASPWVSPRARRPTRQRHLRPWGRAGGGSERPCPEPQLTQRPAARGAVGVRPAGQPARHAHDAGAEGLSAPRAQPHGPEGPQRRSRGRRVLCGPGSRRPRRTWGWPGALPHTQAPVQSGRRATLGAPGAGAAGRASHRPAGSDPRASGQGPPLHLSPWSPPRPRLPSEPPTPTLLCRCRQGPGHRGPEGLWGSQSDALPSGVAAGTGRSGQAPLSPVPGAPHGPPAPGTRPGSPQPSLRELPPAAPASPLRRAPTGPWVAPLGPSYAVTPTPRGRLSLHSQRRSELGD